MKKSTRTTKSIQPVTTVELRTVVGGANSIFVKPCKTKGSLDLSSETGEG